MNSGTAVKPTAAEVMDPYFSGIEQAVLAAAPERLTNYFRRALAANCLGRWLYGCASSGE
jgi:hypothetical protein